MKKYLLSVLLFICLKLSAQTSADVTFQINTQITVTPPSITLTWKKSNLNVTGYNVSRKLRTDNIWTVLANNLPVTDTFYTDNTLLPGVGYEYKVSNPQSSVTGYIYASIGLPVDHHLGKVILMVDSAYIYALASEIKMFETDLIQEGWTVARINIGRTQTVSSVKQSIKSIYQSAPNWVKGIIILGHIPIPYSGLLNPDGHPDHLGAWPTDLYYADTSSTYWTDVTVNNAAAARIENQNIPGDGKFDQTNISQPLMWVSRIDLYDMPAFSANDTLLMQRYIQKNHTYRLANKTYRMRGLVDDNFGYFGGEAFAQNGYRNFSVLLSYDSVTNGDYFTDMKTSSYLWSYGCGGGWYQGAGGVGNTNNFQTDTVQSVFTLLFGSYFGDWDNQNNFLRAPLASPAPTLTNFWAGRPNIFLHHMSLGEPIANGFFATLNNPGLYQPYGYGYNWIHQTLLGDASLKMYPYKGPSGLVVNTLNGGSIASLTWIDSPDPQVIGYYVYRAPSLSDSFVVLNNQYIANTNFNDSTAPKGKNIYMVRAVKLQNTNTGTFHNLSPGIMDSITISTPFAVNDIHSDAIQISTYPNPATDILYIELLNSNERIKYITVTAIDGSIVFENKYNTVKTKLDVHNWSKGNYLLSVHTTDGIKTRKISIK